MSDRMTRISLPGSCGIADYGRRTPTEMIKLIRQYAEREKREAEAILAASDSDFLIETYVGVHVCRNREVLQAPSVKLTNGDLQL